MDISDMRRSYESGELNEADLPSSPKPLFDQWLAEVVESDERDANAMVLSTADQHGGPSSRVVLAKQVTPEGIIFFTNYDSRKAAEIKVNPRVAPELPLGFARPHGQDRGAGRAHHRCRIG